MVDVDGLPKVMYLTLLPFLYTVDRGSDVKVLCWELGVAVGWVSRDSAS